MLNILILCGPTGSGKSYIKYLLTNAGHKKTENNLKKVYFHAPIQVTTREPRSLESLDDYYFVNDEMFDELYNDDRLTCYTHFDGHRYGTLKNNFVLGKDVVNVVVASKEGAKNLINDYSNNPEVSIKTALVMAEPDDGLINEHCRSEGFFKDEFYELVKIPYDYYIPNYMDSRADLDEILFRLGYKNR